MKKLSISLLAGLTITAFNVAANESGVQLAVDCTYESCACEAKQGEQGKILEQYGSVFHIQLNEQKDCLIPAESLLMTASDVKLSPEYSTESSNPAFHDVLASSPNMANYLYSNQIQQESKVDGDVIYTRQHPGAKVEAGFGEVLAATMPKFDARFSQGISPYWTFQIRLARVNSGSKWHNYAKNLPTGIQTIKRRAPTRWMSERVTAWSSVREFKVIVY